MIDWINRVFGIENDVSVPTLISLIVFITGGVASYIFIKVREFNTRKLTRKTTLALLREVVKDLKPKEKNTYDFHLIIKPEHTGHWFLRYKHISYLETLFQLEFNGVYSAFRKRTLWNSNRKLKDKAFHRVWATLRNLRFTEDKIQKDLESLSAHFNVHHKQYNASLSEYRKHHDDLIIKTKGVLIPESEKSTYEYLMKLDRIWYEWQKVDEKVRVAYHFSYSNLIKPALELNRANPDVIFTQYSDNILLDCTQQYIEIESALSVYQQVFRSHYQTYRSERKLLEKCISILK